MKSYSVHTRDTNVPVVSWYHKLKAIVTPVNYDIRPRIEKTEETRGGDSPVHHRSQIRFTSAYYAGGDMGIQLAITFSIFSRLLLSRAD